MFHDERECYWGLTLEPRFNDQSQPLLFIGLNRFASEQPFEIDTIREALRQVWTELHAFVDRLDAEDDNQ